VIAISLKIFGMSEAVLDKTDKAAEKFWVQSKNKKGITGASHFNRVELEQFIVRDLRNLLNWGSHIKLEKEEFTKPRLVLLEYIVKNKETRAVPRRVKSTHNFKVREEEGRGKVQKRALVKI